MPRSPSKMGTPSLLNILESHGEANGNGNGTKVNLTDLPHNILEAFIPGYSLISRFILDVFGFDVGIVVSIGVLAFALFSSFNYLSRQASSLFSKWYMSAVYVDDNDDLYDSVLEWIAEQRMSKVSRSIKAVTRAGNSYGLDLDDDDDDEALDEEGIFNFGKWAAKVPPRYEPYFGSHRFWHKGRIFMFDRSRRELQANPYHPNRKEEELMKLSCIGRTTQPIKHLLDHIKVWSIEKEKAMTVIRRPAAKDRGRFAGAWDRVSSRPSRPMETVALDPVQKRNVVDDINEYLHPSSPRWYATRGIPYRRGYLFHGPPGTGKTSLSFALAGIFGLDIYVISLLEPTLTESDLNRLFNNLPGRCIVLLEDIDTAGLLRDEKSDRDDDVTASNNSNGNDNDDHPAGPHSSKTRSANKDEAGATATATETLTPEATALVRAIKSATATASTSKHGKSADDNKQGISLSGLLNAIDGVATHEGRVLVMTTNQPESLDGALIRPGRVDMQVEFALASRAQMGEIFVRMYFCGSGGGSSEKEKAKAKLMNGSANSIAAHKSLPSLTRQELLVMAERFAAQIPEGRLSPAEIQGFLLTRKKEPERAVAEVEGWCRMVLEAKERGGKVVRG